MYRVGIITFHCSYNYGSVLQAFALQTYLETQGYSAKIINYVLTSNFEQYRLFRINKYKESLKYLISDLLFFVPNYRRKINFENFQKKYLSLSDKTFHDNDNMNSLNNEFDAFICGSDQIWNLDCTNGVNPPYFLNFAQKDKLKISYAPSLAHRTFSESFLSDLKNAIKNIDFISIREESTIDAIKGLTDKHIKVVLDPTLLLCSTQYEPVEINPKKNKDYVFVYMLENNSEFISYCNCYSKENNLKIYYLSQKRMSGLNGENLFGIKPEEFLGYIKNAQCIITNSFHATVFSIIYHKQFCTFPTLKSSSRMSDLLSELGLSNRFYDNDFKMNNFIDYDYCDRQLDFLRKESQNYLLEALSTLEQKNERK